MMALDTQVKWQLLLIQRVGSNKIVHYIDYLMNHFLNIISFDEPYGTRLFPLFLFTWPAFLRIDLIIKYLIKHNCVDVLIYQ